MRKWMLAAGLVVLLAGCSADDETETNRNSVDDGAGTNENNAIAHSAENSVGFAMDDTGEIQQADVPEAEAEAILSVFEEYIAAFNAEDLERYGAVLADNPESFEKETDLAALEEAFESYTTTYDTSDETIVKFEGDRAEVFANITIATEEKSTGRGVEQEGRQVVVFTKEDGEWKVTSLYFMGNS